MGKAEHPWLVGACLLSLLTSSVARADVLQTELEESDTGFIPVQELSYEAILHRHNGYDAELRIRIALHNNSFRHRFCLPS